MHPFLQIGLAASPLLGIAAMVAVEVGPAVHRETLAGLRGLSENMAFVGGAAPAIWTSLTGDGEATASAGTVAGVQAVSSELVSGAVVFALFVFVCMYISVLLKRKDEIEQLRRRLERDRVLLDMLPLNGLAES
jgi:hypothetical protein